MVEVTARALEALGKVRAAERAFGEQAIGLVPTVGGIGLVLDVPAAADRVFSREGKPVVFVDATLVRRLYGRVLDYAGPPGQERFILDRSPGVPDTVRNSRPRR